MGVTGCSDIKLSEKGRCRTSFKSELGAVFQSHVASYKLILAPVQTSISPQVKEWDLLMHPAQCLVSCHRHEQMDRLLLIPLTPISQGLLKTSFEPICPLNGLNLLLPSLSPERCLREVFHCSSQRLLGTWQCSATHLRP